MMKQYLMVRDSDNLIYGTSMQVDPDVGPYVPHDPPMEGVTLLPYDPEFTRVDRSDTESAWWIDGEVVWTDSEPLAAKAERTITAMDSAADAVRLKVIGDPTKALEYQRAEMQARAYAAAGYEGQPPASVASWAEAKRWTNGGEPWTGKQSADDIIATADRWYAAMDGIRQLRLDAKEQVRSVVAAEGSNEDVKAIHNSFNESLAALQAMLK